MSYLGLVYDLLWRHHLLSYLFSEIRGQKVETLTSHISVTLWPGEVKLGIPIELDDFYVAILIFLYLRPYCSVIIRDRKTRSTSFCRPVQGLQNIGRRFVVSLNATPVWGREFESRTIFAIFNVFKSQAWIKLFTYPRSVWRIWKAIAISLDHFVTFAISFTSGPKFGSKNAKTPFSSKKSNKQSRISRLFLIRFFYKCIFSKTIAICSCLPICIEIVFT